MLRHQWFVTHRGTVIYEFDRGDLYDCVEVGQQRAIVKYGGAKDFASKQHTAGYDPRVPQVLGHRAEWAFCRLLGLEPPRDVKRGGDKHAPDVFFPYIGKSFEIKYNDYTGGDIQFALPSTDPRAFQADFGVLARRAPNQPRQALFAPILEFYGYFEGQVFFKRCRVVSYGFGDRLVLDTQYISPFVGFLQRLADFHRRKESR